MLAEIVQLELTTSERAELARCESVIEEGLRTFVDVGNALLTIRDKRLYRDEFGTFEAYCRERWGWTRQHANRTIAAAEVARHLEPMGSISGPTVLQNGHYRVTIAPTSERQIRPLTSLEPEQQREVWARAVETAPEGKVTGAHVKRVVEEMQEPSRPHVTHNSGNNEWYTPPEYIAAARRVMGDIDLDPASSDIANEMVQARTYYTAEDDGRLYDWRGRVWMNPPYASHLIGSFADKLAKHAKQGDVTEACVLVNNATETTWFNTLLDVSSCVCFIRGRVKFIDVDGNPSGAPLQGQVVLYIGSDVEAFVDAFSDFGAVLYAGRNTEQG